MAGDLTQAHVARIVRGAIKAHRDAGLPIGSVETLVSSAGVSVKVTAPADSVQPSRPEGVNVEQLKERLRERHASGRAPTGS